MQFNVSWYFLNAIWVTHCRSQEKLNRPQKLFALGGVEAENIAELASLGFNGAAVLGAVWHSPDPVEALLEILNRCQD